MHLVILPGNSKQYNEQWLYDLAEKFGGLFESVTKHVYETWKAGTGEEHADVKLEAEKLADETSALDSEYVIIAKSIGVPVAIHAVVKNGITPTKCVFLGSAVKGAPEDLMNMISQFKIPTLFVEQTNDPIVFTYSELEKFLKENWTGEYKLVETAGANHAYDNYDDIKGWLGEFLK